MEASRACAMMAEYVVGRSDSSGSIEVEVYACKNNKLHVSFLGQEITFHPTESSTLRGRRVSMKLSEAITGRPVVMPNPLSKQYTIHQMTLLR